MVASREIDGRAGFVVALLLMALFVALGVDSARQKSATWDEGVIFGIGAYLLEQGRWDVQGSILHPPLSYYLHGLPLLAEDSVAAAFHPLPEKRTAENLGRVNLDGPRAVLSSPPNRDDALLSAARSVMIVTCALGVLFVYGFARELFGVRSGILAALLYALSPNVLAHGRLITPDGVLTAFCVGAVFASWRSLRSRRTRDVVLAGVLLGLALLAKFTALLLLPVIGALFGADAVRRRRWPRAGAAVFGLAGALLLVGYRLDPGPLLDGLRFQYEHASAGHAGFLLGKYSDTGWWYYIPVAFALKTPIAFLVLLGWATGDLVRRGPAACWLDEAAVLLPPVAFFGFFTLVPQSIGLRYVLPALPFLFVFASRVVGGEGRFRALQFAAVGLAMAHAAASLWIHPHYLAYFNEIGGGPSRGYRHLVDSNLDWGQDLKGLAAFQRARGIERLYLSYFGTDEPSRYGIRYTWLPSFVLRNPSPGRSRGLPASGWIAISATNLQGVYLDHGDTFAAFREREPIARIGHSIFVYRLP